MSLTFQEFLSESMKDPEFAAAYQEISEEESKKIMVAALAEVARMKPVIDAVRNWRRAALLNTNRQSVSKALYDAFDAYEKGS